MTVCVGAICYWHPNNFAVVAASDRMVTVGDFMQYEHEIPKIRMISSHICIMSAGDTLSATTLIQQLFARFKSGVHRVTDVVGAAKDLYQSLRQNQIESQIFAPRSITMEQFYQEGLQSRFQPHLVGGIDDDVMSFDFGVELLIAGTDDEGAHIYTVGNPGIVNNYQYIGYATIGNGSVHTAQSMIGFNHSPFHPLAVTLFTVYASKRRAEAAPGVGRLTDLVVIPPAVGEGIVPGGGGTFVQKPQLESLDTMYEIFRQPNREQLLEMMQSLNLYGQGEGNASDEKQDEGTGEPGATRPPSESVSETVQTRTDASAPGE